LGPVAEVGVAVCPKCERAFVEPAADTDGGGGLALRVRPLTALSAHWARTAMEAADVYAAPTVSVPHMVAVMEREFGVPAATAAGVASRLLQLALRTSDAAASPLVPAEYVFVARRR
jgi:hypothetical protein